MSEIIYTKTKWSDVHRTMTRIMTAVDGEPDSTVVMACIALAVASQVENYTVEQLRDGIKGASEWIALYASSLDMKTSQVLN